MRVLRFRKNYYFDYNLERILRVLDLVKIVQNIQLRLDCSLPCWIFVLDLPKLELARRELLHDGLDMPSLHLHALATL
jgi:hypothetical protein